MRKTILKFTAAAAIAATATVISMTSFATEYKEGVHYEDLGTKASSTPEVSDFFSFFCGHCNLFRPLGVKIKQEIAPVPYNKVHVEFLPNGYPEIGKLMARAHATAIVLKADDKVADEIFDRNFNRKDYIDNVAKLRQSFAIAGVKTEDFDNAYNSFQTNSLVAQMAKKSKELKIHATPSLVVNGKYMVKNGGVSKSTDMKIYTEEYIKLVKYLVTLK